MHASWIARIGFVLLVVGGLFVLPGIQSNTSQPVHTNQTVGLQPPAFITQAHAAPELDIAAKLDEEAGISAYFKSPDAINFNQIRGQFRTIETETADYILGSVGVPNHPENFDAHVYVHKTGWILAYYLRQDPISKIIDVKQQSITTTKLKTVVAAVASAAGAPFTDVSYYDFRYPNATYMMFVAERYDSDQTFTIQLPSSYGYLERGWALIYLGGCCAGLTVDGVGQTSVWQGDSMYYGTLTASQLLPDVTHTVAVDDWGVVVLVYRVP